MTHTAIPPGSEPGEEAPLVSVVLATFNRVNVLQDTLRMVLAQTLTDFELIVCDNCQPTRPPL